MTINTDLWCLVNLPEKNTVIDGPRMLPATYQNRYQFNDDVYTSDQIRNQYGWLIYVENDSGPPDPDPQKKWNRSLSEFSIAPTQVNRDIVYTEFTVAQYDQTAPVTPIDWEQVPPEQRQFVEIPYESVDRFVVGRIMQTWNEPNDIYGLRCTLYATDDATGMSVKIHDDATGSPLYTMPLLPPGDPGNPLPPEDGGWYAETPSGAWGQHLERKPWRYYIFKGVDLTPEMRLPYEWEQATHDIRWNSNGFEAAVGARSAEPLEHFTRRIIDLARRKGLL